MPSASGGSLTPQQAAQELLRRRAAQDSLVAFAQQIDIPGKPLSDHAKEDRFGVIESEVAHHHRLMCEAMQECIETPGGRLMIFMPPGSAKSTYASVVAPTWAMGRRPRFQVILLSYADELAIKHSRRARQIAASRRFNEIFDTSLTGTAADQWAMENGSEYMASGILAGVTGNRGDLLIVDDPMRGREAAESQTIRDKVWDAYQDDARSRLKPGGSRVMTLTRWHEDDPAGRLLPKGWAGESGRILCSDGHEWNVICLPALADRHDDPLGRKLGDGLWPEWFGPGHWDEFKFPPRSWLSLYQQKPTSEQGTFFKREWFAQHRYETAPKDLSIYMSADFAVTGGDGDYTEIAVWGVDHLDNIYALDWYYGQETADVWTRALLDRVDRFRPLWFVGETGPIRRAVEPFLQSAMRERRLFVACEWLPHGTANKEANARSFQALASVGRVHFPQHEAWAERVIDQLLRFPSGRHDDVVDACSLFGRQLEKVWAGPRPKPEKRIDWEAAASTISIQEFEPNDGFRPYA